MADSADPEGPATFAIGLSRDEQRLLMAGGTAWTLFCGVKVAWSEYNRTDRNYAASCQIRQQAVAQFDLEKCLNDPAAAVQKRDQAIEGATNWFMNGGYLKWLLPPFLITGLAVIAIAAGAFVYRGFIAD